MKIFIYKDLTFILALVLIAFLTIFALVKKRYSLFELGRFATIALLILALPRLLYVLFAFAFANLSLEQILSFKPEIVLGVMLLLIRCVAELIKQLK